MYIYIYLCSKECVRNAQMISKMDHEDLFVAFIDNVDKMAVENVVFFLDRRCLAVFTKPAALMWIARAFWLKMLI